MRTFRLPLVIALLAAWTSNAPCEDFEISGFVDASWVLNTADRDVGQFGVDKVELSMRHPVSDRTFVRTDLEWIRDGEDEYLAQIEQAYMQYTMRGGVMFTFGRYNTPFGFEEYDAPDLYQFSSSLVGEYGLPGNFTGFSLGKDLAEGLNLLVMGSNGWDRNFETARNLTWAGRLGYDRDGWTGGLSLISGKQDLDGSCTTRTVFDVDAGYEGGGWVFGAEYNQGKSTVAGNGEHQWWGMLMMARRELNDWFGMTVRYDFLDDMDGGIFGFEREGFEELGPLSQKRQAVAFAPSFALDDGLDLILELRVDMSDRKEWSDRDAEPVQHSTTIAAELLFTF
jgi:hypothetical protein